MKKIRGKLGDVFAIPLDNGEYTFGQIIDDDKQQCYIIFNYISKKYINPQDIVDKKILILAFSVDNFIKIGRWPILGNTKPRQDIIIPLYLVTVSRGQEQKIMVMNHKGQYIREATEKDIKSLSTMSSFSPRVLETTAQVKLLGVGQYYPDMDELFYKGS